MMRTTSRYVHEMMLPTAYFLEVLHTVFYDNVHILMVYSSLLFSRCLKNIKKGSQSECTKNNKENNKVAGGSRLAVSAAAVAVSAAIGAWALV